MHQSQEVHDLQIVWQGLPGKRSQVLALVIIRLVISCRAALGTGWDEGDLWSALGQPVLSLF